MRLSRYILETTPSMENAADVIVDKKKPLIIRSLKSSKSFSSFIMGLNNIFMDINVVFVPTERPESERVRKYIAGGVTNITNGSIAIFPVNIEIENIKPEIFFKDLKKILTHELMHRYQAISSKGNIRGKKHTGITDYLSSDPEIEAYANDSYMDIKKGDTQKLEDILSWLNIPTRKKFLKKVYFYAKNDKKALELIKNVLNKGGL